MLVVLLAVLLLLPLLLLLLLLTRPLRTRLAPKRLLAASPQDCRKRRQTSQPSSGPPRLLSRPRPQQVPLCLCLLPVPAPLPPACVLAPPPAWPLRCPPCACRSCVLPLPLPCCLPPAACCPGAACAYLLPCPSDSAQRSTVQGGCWRWWW